MPRSLHPPRFALLAFALVAIAMTAAPAGAAQNAPVPQLRTPPFNAAPGA
jgi:hypothetical protein